MSNRSAQRSIAISEALGIQDQSTTKQVEAIAALREEVGRLREALRRMIDRAENVPHFDDDGDLSAAQASLSAKEEA